MSDAENEGTTPPAPAGGEDRPDDMPPVSTPQPADSGSGERGSDEGERPSGEAAE